MWSFILSVSRIIEKVMSGFHWNLGVMIGRTNGKKTFGGDPVPDTDSGSLFHFPHHCGIGDFRRFISISHTVAGQFLWNMAKSSSRMRAVNHNWSATKQRLYLQSVAEISRHSDMAKWLMVTGLSIHNILGVIRQTSGPKVIWKS